MYPNVNADYTVVPASPSTPLVQTNSLVTLTDGTMIDVDDNGEVRGVFHGQQQLAQPGEPMPGWYAFWAIASTVSMAACAYHGYRRNRSVGWAIGWGILGGIFPILTPAIAVGQGFGKRK